MRRRLLRRRGGRLQSPGHDHESGHLTYVEQLGQSGEQWLRTKPFSAPPKDELARCLHSFAHIVDRLGLGVRAQVLDVGCGPGWLSEFLARCGYWVTGVDVSEDMVRIARERVAAIAGPVGEGIEPLAEFHALPVRELPWSDRFDAAVLYDTMHHFDDEVETLRVIQRTLVPGGRIYIEEGVRPPPGSEAERSLIAEMEQFGTLESPFDPDYLVAVLEEAGFVDITRFAEVDELFDIADPEAALELLTHRLRYPDMNTLIAGKPVPVELAGEGPSFRGRLEPVGEWWASRDGRDLLRRVQITNTGQAFWPAATRFPYPQGSVTIGAYLPDANGERAELPRTALPRSLSPGEDALVDLQIPRAVLEGTSEITVDLVREGLAWFAELGSEPLVIPLPEG